MEHIVKFSELLSRDAKSNLIYRHSVASSKSWDSTAASMQLHFQLAKSQGTGIVQVFKCVLGAGKGRLLSKESWQEFNNRLLSCEIPLFP